MVDYTPTPSDVEMGLEERTGVLVEKKPSRAWIWSLTVTLVIVALFFGGVLFGGVLQKKGILQVAWSWNLTEIRRHSGQTGARVGEEPAETSEPHYTLKQISSKAKAAVHLEGSYDDEEDSLKDRLEWKNGQGQAFTQGGFLLVDNQIVIPQTGLYFVYSQASFRVSCSDGEEEEEDEGKRFTPLSHSIWRHSDSIGGKVSLMSAVRSACQTTAQEEDSYRDGRGWYNAIYLGAVFQLNKGDKLWTETNQLSELDTDEGKTFFGVFAL